MLLNPGSPSTAGRFTVVQFNNAHQQATAACTKEPVTHKSLYITGRGEENKHAAFMTQTIPVHTAHRTGYHLQQLLSRYCLPQSQGAV